MTRAICADQAQICANAQIAYLQQVQDLSSFLLEAALLGSRQLQHLHDTGLADRFYTWTRSLQSSSLSQLLIDRHPKGCINLPASRCSTCA